MPHHSRDANSEKISLRNGGGRQSSLSQLSSLLQALIASYTSSSSLCKQGRNLTLQQAESKACVYYKLEWCGIQFCHWHKYVCHRIFGVVVSMCFLSVCMCASWDSLLVEHQTRDQKGASSNPGGSDRRISFSRVNMCANSFSVRSTLVLPLWHVKDASHSAKSTDGRLHLNTHALLTDQIGLGWLCCCAGTVWEPIRKQAHMQLIREVS